MSAPFGGHPTFAEYQEWAVNEQGCKVKSGCSGLSNGAVYSFTVIDSPSGQWVIVPDVGAHEFLLPTFIQYLDRRLGLTSPFLAWPAE